MPRRSHVFAIITTQDLNTANEVFFMFDHLKSVGRPCAIVRRVFKKHKKVKGVRTWVDEVKYSTWRTVTEDEQPHYRDLDKLDKLREGYEVVQESGGFSAIMAG